MESPVSVVLQPFRLYACNNLEVLTYDSIQEYPKITRKYPNFCLFSTLRCVLCERAIDNNEDHIGAKPFIVLEPITNQLRHDD